MISVTDILYSETLDGMHVVVFGGIFNITLAIADIQNALVVFPNTVALFESWTHVVLKSTGIILHRFFIILVQLVGNQFLEKLTCSLSIGAGPYPMPALCII